MSKPSASTINLAAAWIPGLVFAGALALGLTGLWQPADRAFTDLLWKTRLGWAPLAQSPRIIPVDLNDSAERNLGSAVETRQAFADLLRVLGDGKLVGGMDFLFAGTKDKAGDASMVAAAQKMDALVMAIVPVDPGITRFSGHALDSSDAEALRAHLWHPRVVNAGLIPTAETFLLPHTGLAAASRWLGHIGVRPDSDGLYRKTPLFYRWADGYVPSLGLAMAAVALHIDPSQVVVEAGRAVTLPTSDGPLAIPVDDQGYAWIPYPNLWANTWKRTPLDRVTRVAADAEQEDQLLQSWDSGLVLAADLTTSHKDFGSTPIETIYPLSGIHSSLLNGILTRTLVSEPSPWWEALFLAGLLAAVVGASQLRRNGSFHGAFAGLMAVLLVGSVTLWWAFLTVPWFAGPALALIAAWLTSTIFRLVQAHEERALMESALSRYFPRALASRVLDEKKVDLVPADKDLTLLFADIAGFTKWSSDKPAALVHEFLSDYLESMAAILFAHGGTVDKFMGDGILAFFGDPFDMPDHAPRCIQAALAMQAKVVELRDKWKDQASIDLKIRIGINSGRVIVGNLGSMTRIEYTVIGSAVNLAQRMESNAPVDGILVTEETYSRTKDQFPFSPPRKVTVKGYDDVVLAYEVLP